MESTDETNNNQRERDWITVSLGTFQKRRRQKHEIKCIIQDWV